MVNPRILRGGSHIAGTRKGAEEGNGPAWRLALSPSVLVIPAKAGIHLLFWFAHAPTLT
jgi:hypothetical protein